MSDKNKVVLIGESPGVPANTIYALNTDYMAFDQGAGYDRTVVTLTGFVCPDCGKQRTMAEFYFGEGEDAAVSCTVCKAKEFGGD